MENKELLQNQIGLFFKQEFQGSFEEVSLALKKILGNDAGTQIFTLPHGTPPEVPRLMLNVPGITINFAKNRIDIFSQSYTTNSNNINKVIGVMVNDLKISISRVGFVANYFLNGDVETLKNLFSQEKIKNLNIKEVGFRVNVLSKIGLYNCNNIQNIQNGEIKKGITSKNGLVIQRDINSLQNLQINFDFSTIVNFIIDANKETDKLLIL